MKAPVEPPARQVTKTMMSRQRRSSPSLAVKMGQCALMDVMLEGELFEWPRRWNNNPIGSARCLSPFRRTAVSPAFSQAEWCKLYSAQLWGATWLRCETLEAKR